MAYPNSTVINQQKLRLEREKNTKEFLIKLAQYAKPNTFYPFPEYFRHKGSASQTNSILSDSSENKTNITKFKPYSIEDYNYVKQLLSSISTDIDNPTEEQQQLLKYIYDIPIKIIFYGNNFHSNITEYQFDYPALSERILNIKYKSRWYLFHGSPICNWHSILRNGIKNMSDTQFMKNGTAYGKGVYLTDSFTYACTYGSSEEKFQCVAVVEIFQDPEKFNKSPGIYVIPDDNILLPRYLLKIKTGTKISDKNDILQYYKKIKDREIMALPLEKRINKELADIKKLSSVSIMDNNIISPIILIHQVIVKLDLTNYPFDYPLIYLTYQLVKPLKEFNNQGIYLDTINHWMPTQTLVEIIKKLSILLEHSSMTEFQYQL